MSLIGIILLFLLNCSNTQLQPMSDNYIQHIVKVLSATKYAGLFYLCDRSLIDSVWQNGKNQQVLEKLVTSSQYNDYVRFLASEILFEKASDYPPDSIKNTLGLLYAKAMVGSSTASNDLWISGNEWGFMYHTDNNGITDYGTVGSHLISLGKHVVPNLVKLLNDNSIIFYIGSQEATLGNSLHYRVKDAAAYYIGKIAGIPVKFYESNAERDTEIERIKQLIK
jgi:hypothetical protein